MSPLDLPGPQFLVFYLFFGVCVLLGLVFLRYIGKEPDPPTINLSNPYLIAYLRGGKNEALRVATVSLIDRGLLSVSGTTVFREKSPAAAGLRLPIERKLLYVFEQPAAASTAFTSQLLFETERYEEELVRLELLPGPEQKSAQRAQLAVVLLLLWGMAGIKIAVALSRGRTNILFLMVLAIVFSLIAWKLALPRVTRKGRAAIESLHTLFGSLKERATSLLPGQNPNELLLLAAVFGVGTIPKSIFPYATDLYPQASSSGGSCGSSCGSSCGGGGCGGGCGGCGG